jgi:O-antigen/teichoic acid export membrane protein
MGIQNLLGPKIAHTYAASGPKAMRRVVLRITAALSLPVSLLSLVLIIWGGRFITLLYGKQYAGNNLVVAILAVNLLAYVASFPFSRALMATDRANLDFLLNLVALFIMVTIGFSLVRAFGTLGAAIGLLLATSTTSSIRAAVFLRLPTRISEVGDVDAA